MNLSLAERQELEQYIEILEQALYQVLVLLGQLNVVGYSSEGESDQVQKLNSEFRKIENSVKALRLKLLSDT